MLWISWKLNYRRLKKLKYKIVKLSSKNLLYFYLLELTQECLWRFYNVSNKYYLLKNNKFYL